MSTSFGRARTSSSGTPSPAKRLGSAVDTTDLRFILFRCRQQSENRVVDVRMQVSNTPFSWINEFLGGGEGISPKFLGGSEGISPRAHPEMIIDLRSMWEGYVLEIWKKQSIANMHGNRDVLKISGDT